VIGDAVNTAARVEQATRETGDVVLITEATRCLLHEDHGVAWVRRAPVDLKGKSERVVLYAPVPAERDGDARRRGAAEPRRGGEAARAA
jgi:class 3 adenylate cyclase